LLLLAPIRDRQPPATALGAPRHSFHHQEVKGSARELVWPFDRMDCASSLPAASGLDRRKGFTAAAFGFLRFGARLFPALEGFFSLAC